MPAQYYSRFNESKNYDQHLFIAGRGLQSAELNEIQISSSSRIKKIADALFRDGDVIRDAAVIIDQDTGVVQCQSGAVYINGAVRGVPPKTFTIPLTGEVAIGIRLVETVVTHLDDTELLDPATGTRNYQEPGAERLKVEALWGWDGDGGVGNFYPVYSATAGVMDAKEPPPNMDAVTQALARYDRDSAGGTYIVHGLRLTKMPDNAGAQIYSLGEGRARVFGYGVEFSTARRLSYPTSPDLKIINNEPHLSTTIGAQRVLFDRAPGTAITEVTITAQKTVTVTHGPYTGAIDPLPDTSVLSIVSVTQDVTTYVAGTDYTLTAGQVDWSPGGAEPATGSTYTVVYQYLTNVTPTAVDDDGFSVTGAVVGALILISYSQKLPRYDKLCVNQEGALVWVKGVAAEFNPLQPIVPSDLLSIATVYQNWRDTRPVLDDGVYMVPMPSLAKVEGRMDLIVQLLAQQRLESNIHTRESGTKKGLFTDPFYDESQRDAGTEQTAAIVQGELVIPISATVYQLPSDVASPVTMASTVAVALSQTLKSGSMQINPYMSFAPVPGSMTLTPAVDRWTEIQNEYKPSGETFRFTSQTGYSASQAGTSTEQKSVIRNLLDTQQSNLETLRPITISYQIKGLGNGEALSSLTFDGVAMSVAGVVANSSGVASGSFVIPTGIPSGSKNVVAVGAGGTRSSAIFSGQGTLERKIWCESTGITTINWVAPPPPPPPPPPPEEPTDPLAQTFLLGINTQCAGVDLWFAAKPTTPTRVQIRGTTAGMPNGDVLVTQLIAPASINTGGASTRVIFDAPVALIGGVEYAIVVLCDDNVGALSVAELGKFDSTVQRWITTQPYTVGVLLSSSNASTWTPHQDRDMTFAILSTQYTQTSRTVGLGAVNVTGATEFLMMAYAERPASVTSVDYTLTLPDSTVLTIADGQPVHLSAAVTGSVAVAARLTGTADFAPVLHPGSQLVAGTLGSTATYVSRAVPAGSNVIVKVIYEGNLPSGSTVAVHYKGQDLADTWVAIGTASTLPVDDGFVEFVHSVSAVTETSVQIRLTLNGTAAARPRVRDLRVIVLEDI